MTITLQCKGLLLISCNSCSVVQSYNYIPNFYNLCNSKDIELYIDGKNKKEIEKIRNEYILLEKFIKKGDNDYYEISLDI